MKIFYSEYTYEYKTYTFGWAVYCIPKDFSELKNIYSMGFLPYSGMLQINNIFYLARSIRINLDDFCLTRNDKYILKKTRDLNISMEMKPKEEIISSFSTFKKLSLKYIEARFDDGVFNEERLNYIMTREYLNKIMIIYKNNMIEEPLGYALIISCDDIVHVWYSFYQLDQNTEKNVGKCIIMKIIEKAKYGGYKYCYLGSCYGSGSRYKSDFTGSEFYDGRGWSRDLTILKKLWEDDDEKKQRDRDIFKSGYFSI